MKKIDEKSLYKAIEKALYRYNDVLVSIDTKEDELKILIRELKALKVDLDDYQIDTVQNETGIHTSGISKALENKVAKKEKIKNVDIPNKRKEIFKKKVSIDKDKTKLANIDRAISNLDPRQKQIIEKFYKRKMKICDIAGEIFLEEAQTHNIKKIAVKAIASQIYGYEYLEQDDNLLKMI